MPIHENARVCILERRDEIAEICNACDPMLVKLGGGFRDIEVRVIRSQGGPMVVTHIIVDTRDAMGANAVNTMAETLAPEIEAWTGGKVLFVSCPILRTVAWPVPEPCGSLVPSAERRFAMT